QRELDIELSRSRLIASMFGRAVHRPRVGRFELHEHLGRGGMGTVYLARDHQLERDVAVKVVDTRHLGATTRARALREARGLARLAHPNVVTVFEVGLHEEFVWFAMEYVAGETVRQWLQRAPRTASEILQVWIAAGRGLAAVHAAGLVHRDIKPSNVLIDDHGRLRLIAFGLVRESRSGRARSPARAS
ncbi:MAG: serine/threonine protein kinase, partial [Myxococcales bacterium]|nr:serine/threonine protein kinase [Myxococcales bacterium]